MFNVVSKSPNQLTVQYQFANVNLAPREISLEAKNQTQLLYLYVANLQSFIHESLDRCLQEANAIRAQMWQFGLANKEISNAHWKFLSKKERWQKTGNWRFMFEEILEFDFQGVIQFGGITTALVADIKSCAKNGLATLSHIQEINAELYSNKKSLIQKRAS